MYKTTNSTTATEETKRYATNSNTKKHGLLLTKKQQQQQQQQRNSSNKIITNGLLPESVEKNYQCNICELLMLGAIVQQTASGLLACKDCYEDKLREDPTKCPIEGVLFEDQDNDGFPPYFVDKAKEKEIGNLECECPKSQCGWKGCVRDFLKNHYSVCSYQPTQCQFCDESFERQEENQHLGKCEGLFKDGPCIYKNAGCSFIANSREDMKEHMYQAVQMHFMYEKKRSDQMEEKLNNLTQSNTQHEIKIEQLSKQQAGAQQHVETKLTAVDSTQQDLARKLGDVVTLVSSIEKTSSSNNNNSNNNSNSNNKKIDTDSFTGDIADLTKSLADLDLRFQLHENSTFDGVLLWKINNYTKRRQDAKSGSITALHSSPCFTSRYGYKYCLRLYLNGDGMGHGSYLSLFLVIMKSEYDNVLQWPFQKKVKFTMVNQVDRNRDISERMMPDKNSSSFQKPVRDMNVASGCPQFISIDRLAPEGFLKDDSLFIEVNIL